MTNLSLRECFLGLLGLMALTAAVPCRAEMRVPEGGVGDPASFTQASPATSVGAVAQIPGGAPVAASTSDGLPASAPRDPLPRDLLPPKDVLRVPAADSAFDLVVVDPLRAADDAAPYSDLWERIRDGFDLTPVDGPRVNRQVEWFERHEDYVTRLADRSRKYLYFIVEEVQKRGMPTEIALLPIVESAFNPTATSPAKASGIWQFMPATGREYGLRQNWWYDGRRDIVAATNGALDYLQKLHTQFGAWDLALAAYNCGEGAVARAIERNQRAGRPTNYADLNLPEETRNYVPKLLAAREIVADPAAHGLVLPSIPDAPYFAAVTTDRHIDLAVAARFASLSVADFLALNPGYNRPLILAQGTQTILVPTEIAEAFTARLNDPEARLVSWRTHRLKRGENLASVASRFGMSSDELKRVNGISAFRRVAGGGTILVRDANADEGDLDGLSGGTQAEADLAAPTETVSFSHRVVRGESLASVARRFNVSVNSLRTWNRIPRNRGARIGQLLVMHRTAELGAPELRAGLETSAGRSTAAESGAADEAVHVSETTVYESGLAQGHPGRGRGLRQTGHAAPGRGKAPTSLHAPAHGRAPAHAPVHKAAMAVHGHPAPAKSGKGKTAAHPGH